MAIYRVSLHQPMMTGECGDAQSKSGEVTLEKVRLSWNEPRPSQTPQVKIFRGVWEGERAGRVIPFKTELTRVSGIVSVAETEW